MRSNMPAPLAKLLAIASGLIALLWVLLPAQAGPRIVEEQARISMPGPSGQLISAVGMSGDSMFVTTRRNFTENGVELAEMSAYLFRRTTAGQWQYVSTLMQTRSDFGDAITYYTRMEGNIGVVQEGGALNIYERTTAGAWLRTGLAFQETSSGGIQIDGGTIVTGQAQCSWEAFRKNTAGTWVRVGGIDWVPPEECVYGSTDVSGTTVVVGRSLGGSLGQVFVPSVRVYTGLSFTPTVTTVLSPHGEDDVYFGAATAIDGNMLLTTSAKDRGVQVFRRNSGQWNYLMSAAAADAYRDRSRANITSPYASSNLVVAAQQSNDHRAVVAGALDVYRRNSDGTITQTARLLASDAHFGMSMGSWVAISGQRIATVAHDPDAVYIFELPSDLSQPALLQENFQTGNGSNWTPIAGSSFSVVPAGSSRVYRQSSTASGAGSYRTNMDWKDQSIQADVRPTAFDGVDRWFGLAVRRTDAANYYYVTLRSSNAIDLKRIVNGSFVTLASAPLPVQLNRNYRLRLEAVGTWIRAYVDGELAVEARDSTLTHGQAGVQMYRTRADYDNIVISPSPLQLYDDDFELDDFWWTKVDGTWSRYIESTEDEITLDAYRQSSTASGARAVIGVSTGDQVVQTRARVVNFAGSNVWFGVMARYVDSRNYYYITMRNNGTLSLRKLVNDNIVVLGTASLTVTPNTWYDLRLDVIGNSLRAYVNGVLRLEATDTSFSKGRYGLVTYKTVADYDSLHVSQP